MKVHPAFEIIKSYKIMFKVFLRHEVSRLLSLRQPFGNCSLFTRKQLKKITSYCTICVLFPIYIGIILLNFWDTTFFPPQSVISLIIYYTSSSSIKSRIPETNYTYNVKIIFFYCKKKKKYGN